jgi:hypothetical protein
MNTSVVSMGTSTNQPSPKTPGWDLVRALLGREGVEPSRQATEVWRAVVGERNDLLLAEVSSPLVADACKIAGRVKSPSAAIREFENLVLQNRAAGLVLDLCKNALARTVVARTGSQGFGTEFFAEMTDYYVSRDLPSYTGAPTRMRTVSDAIQLKKQLRNSAAEVARSAGSVGPDAEGWREYAVRVINALQQRG